MNYWKLPSSSITLLRGALIQTNRLDGPICANFDNLISMQVRTTYKRKRVLPGFRKMDKLKRATKTEKVPLIPRSRFNPDFNAAPVSGSRAFDQDMATEREESREFISDLQSLSARGFFRFQKAYNPPEDAAERLLEVVKKSSRKLANLGDDEILEKKFDDAKFKYEILANATKEFQHCVPNSLLHNITSIAELVVFYQTEVKTSTPYDDLLKASDLPPNLHLQKDPVRFTEETKQYFGGRTAYPGDNTIITGLRAKKKYTAYKDKPERP